MVYAWGLTLEVNSKAAKLVRVERTITPEFLRQVAYATPEKYQKIFDPRVIGVVRGFLENSEDVDFGVEHLKEPSKVSYEIIDGRIVTMHVPIRIVSNYHNKDKASAIVTRDIGQLLLTVEHQKVPSDIILKRMKLEQPKEKDGAATKIAKDISTFLGERDAYFSALGVADYLADVVLRSPDDMLALYELKCGKGFPEKERNIHHSYLKLEKKEGLENTIKKAKNLELPKEIIAAPKH